MVDFKKLAQSASDLVNKRGGMKSLQEDADELMNIAKGEGSLSDKAKRGADALKQPGARREASGSQQQPAPAPEPQADHAPEGTPPESSSPPNA